jgi:hypothetical protein
MYHANTALVKQRNDVIKSFLLVGDAFVLGKPVVDIEI